MSSGNWSSYREPAAPHRQPLDVSYPLGEGQAQDDVRVAYGRKYWRLSATHIKYRVIKKSRQDIVICHSGSNQGEEI